MIRIRHLLISLTLAVILSTVFGGAKAHAALGEVTNTFPNSSLGAETTYAVSELCSNNTANCMKGAITYALVLIPTNLLGKQVDLTIEDGCDSTPVDNSISSGDSFGFTADTRYEMINSAGVFASITTPANAGNGSMGPQCTANQNLNFSFIVPGNVAVVDGFYKYVFRATAFRPQADGFSYYLNFYRINAQTSGVLVDKINFKYPCSNVTYPKSCPLTTYSYSSVGQPGSGTYGQQTLIDTRCNITDTQLFVYMYDLDTGVGNANNYGQNDVRGQVIETDPVTGAVTDVIPNQPGGALSDTGFPFSMLPQSYVGNDAELDLDAMTQTDNPATPNHGYSEPFGYPKGTHLMMKPNKIYKVILTNLNKQNALQLIIKTDPYHPSKNCLPLGYFDSCSLIAGVTHFYGWAYDSDATTSAEPQVSLSINGGASIVSGNIPTDKDLRTAAIETYLGGVRPGMPLVRYYGFDWAVNGPPVGGSYTVTGVALNTGGGASVALKYNTTNFPGGTIPAACLPPATTPAALSCSALTFSEMEYGNQGTLSATLTNGSPVTASPSITINSVSYASVPAGMTTSGSATYNPGAVVARQGGQTVINQLATFPAIATYAVTATVNYTDGITTGSIPCTGNITASILPYLKVYGGDVSAGGGFQYNSGSSCAPGVSGSINAYAEQVGAVTTDYRGSSGQFGVLALLNINGFYSTSNRSTINTNLPPKSLSFSNTDGNPTYGGAYGGSGTCITDYYGLTQNNPTARASIDAAVASSPAGKSQYTTGVLGGAGNLVIPTGRQIAVYVNGDIYIDRNIMFDTAGARTTTADIPYFALIVKGNIYIAPSVSRLDGVYIAQPSNAQGPTNGKIYTCAKPTGSYTSVELYDNCKGSSLVVNGSLVAQQIKFMRTVNSLKNGVVREAPSDFNTGAGTNAAEIINYTPEIYLAPSPLKNPNSSSAASGAQPYDAIFSLPPVF